MVTAGVKRDGAGEREEIVMEEDGRVVAEEEERERERGGKS